MKEIFESVWNMPAKDLMNTILGWTVVIAVFNVIAFVVFRYLLRRNK